MNNSMDYKSSGVDIDSGNKFVNIIKPFVKRTFNSNVLSEIGGFAAFYELSKELSGMKEPVLCSSTDGVGTKLKVAIDLKQYDSLGVDLVAMCVNDLVVTGAKPLFFLDYLATAKLDLDVMTEVVKGIVKGCEMAGIALLGGETAEMPGMYNPEDFDIAGFAVGIVDRSAIIDGKDIEKDDVVLGLPSSGFHSNGYSFLRKIVKDKKLSYSEKINDKLTLGECLLTPTKIYVDDIKLLINSGVKIKGLAHITGGGFYENIPRILPGGLGIDIYSDAYDMPACYHFLIKYYEGELKELYRVFNMGIGMVVVASKEEATKILNLSDAGQITAYEIGVVTDNATVRVGGVDF